MFRRLTTILALLGTFAGLGDGLTNGLVTAVVDSNFVLRQDDRLMLCYAPNSHGVRPGDTIAFSEMRRCADPSELMVLVGTKVTGHVAPPPPYSLSVDELATGSHNLRLVSVRGLAEEAFQDEIDHRWIHLRLHGERESVLVSARRDDIGAERLAALPGARISVTGLCLDTMYGKRRYVGRRILLQKPTALAVLAPAPSDPLNVPPLDGAAVRTARDLSRLGRHSATGTVLACWGRSHVLIDAGALHIRADLADGETLPHPGDAVKAAGLPETDLFSVILTSARLRTLVRARAAPAPVGTATDVRSLFAGYGGRHGFDDRTFGRAIRVEGLVRELPPPAFGHVPWILSSGDAVLPVDTSACPEALRGVRPGSRLSVTGVVVPTTENWRPSVPFPRVTGLTLVPRGPGDIAVLEGPSWWTPVRLTVAILLMLAVLVGIVVWHFLTRINARAKIAERTRLAVELHDSLSQNLTGIAFQLATTKSALENEPSAVARHLETAERMLLSSRTELRRCLWDLRGDTLEDDDFARAIRRTVEPVIGPARVAVRFPVPRSLLSDTLAHAILCIVRELASNAVRHGGAATVRIAGEHHGGLLSLSVRDDGRGFDPANRPDGASGHFGLDGIAERVERLEGRLAVESAPARGARITITEIKL